MRHHETNHLQSLIQKSLKGDIVATEKPLICLQTLQSMRCGLYCNHCCSPIGDWQAHAELLLDEDSDGVSLEPRMRCIESLVNSGYAWPCTQQSFDKPINNSNCCPQVYCSEQCQRFCNDHYHNLICPLTATTSERSEGDELRAKGIVQFHRHAEQSSEVDVFRAAITLIALMIRSVQKGETVSAVVNSFDDEFPLDEAPLIKSDGSSVSTKGRRYDQLWSEQVHESWILMYAALQHVDHAAGAVLLTFDVYNRIALACRWYGRELVSSVSGPLHQHFGSYFTRRQAVAQLDTNSTTIQEEKILNRFLDIIFYDEVELKKITSENTLLLHAALRDGLLSINGAAAPMVQQLDRLRQCSLFPMAGDRSPALLGCVTFQLLPYSSKHCMHSCVPSLGYTFTTELIDHKVCTYITALQSILWNEIALQQLPSIQLIALSDRCDLATISYINLTDESVSAQTNRKFIPTKSKGFELFVEKRQQLLREKFVSLNSLHYLKCSCPRCLVEREVQLNPVIDMQNMLSIATLQDLVTLGHLYMQQNRYALAMRLYKTVISSTSFDSAVKWIIGDAFHALGAAYLEGSDDWNAARVIWIAGYNSIPSHQFLQKEVEGNNRYETVDVTVLKRQRQYCSQLPLQSDGKDFSHAKRLCDTRQIIDFDNVVFKDFPSFQNGVDYTVHGVHVMTESQYLPAYTGVAPVCRSDSNRMEYFGCYGSAQRDTKLVFATDQLHSVLAADVCVAIINAVELHASEKSGWTTQRHYAVPTTDQPVHTLHKCILATGSKKGQSILQVFNETFQTIMAPLLALQFADEYKVSLSQQQEQRWFRVAVHDAFIVKYTAVHGQPFLPLHCDQSTHSFIVALNDSNEYEGGGTYFPDLQLTLRPGIGQLLSFAGGRMGHGGAPVTKGTRYILAVFAYVLEMGEGEQAKVDPNIEELLRLNLIRSKYVSKVHSCDADEESAPAMKRNKVHHAFEKPIDNNNTMVDTNGDVGASFSFGFQL